MIFTFVSISMCFYFQINMGLGELPKEYNKAVHGRYDPAVFYGKKDVPLGQVNLKK